MKIKPLVLLIVGVAILAGRNALYGFNIKDGVSGTLHPVMDTALDAVRRVWASHGLGYPTITSIGDGEHMVGSKHYEGLAFDVRLNTINPTLHETLKREVKALSGVAFDIVHNMQYHGQDKDHLHIEYDPK